MTVASPNERKPQVNADRPKTPQESDDKAARYLDAIKRFAKPGATFSAVAKEMGIDRRTLFSWRQDPVYRFIESAYLDDVLGAARAELLALVLDAVAVLREALSCSAADRDEAAKWPVKLAAARDVLDRVGVKAESIRDGDKLTDEDLERIASELAKQGGAWAQLAAGVSKKDEAH